MRGDLHINFGHLTPYLTYDLTEHTYHTQEATDPSERAGQHLQARIQPGQRRVRARRDEQSLAMTRGTRHGNQLLDILVT
jgi:hypothetical protein